MSKDILSSKGLWIFALIVFIIITIYLMRENSNKPWTAEEERDSIQECQKWGGNVFYDSNGNFSVCEYNGKSME